MSVRRWASTSIVMVGLVVGVGACGTDTTEPAASSTDENPTSSALSGSWTGTWTADGTSADAHLGVVTDTPFLATVDLPGRCGATWTEKSRQASTVVVTSTVTYGNCPAGDWTLTVGDTSITAVGHDVTAQFHRG